MGASSRQASGSHDKSDASESIRDKSYAPRDIYWGNGHVRGRCSVCGDTKQHRQTKNHKYWKPYYFRVFEKVDIFRGNDEYLGMICKQCLSDGKLMLVNKFHPNQLKDEAEE